MESVAKELVENLGGLSNINQVEECITRIRVSVKSLDKVNTKNIKMLEEVLQIFIADTVQIVLGPGKSRKIAKLIRNFEKIGNPEEKQEKKDGKVFCQDENINCQKKGMLKTFIKKILKNRKKGEL